LQAKRTNESAAQGDGLGVLRQGLKQSASRLPNFDFDYIDVALTLLRTALEIKSYYMVALLNQVDLTPARLGLLMALFLCEDQAVPASELAELMVVTPGNITGLVDGLVKDRLVRRVTYPGDRRAVLIELTEKGRRFVRWFAPIHFRLIRSLMSGLSRTQARSLARLLDAVRKQVRSVPPPVVRSP
jgi:DNA-binding MarR family transcriptional regulator